MNLDIAALRTFVTAAETGGFGKAADRLHRTPGAVSLQMKTLEERLSEALFRKAGRRLQLTAAGETLLGHARRILAANDEAILAMTGLQAAGEVRFGMTQDLADAWLSPALGRFSRAYPATRLEVRIARSGELATALDEGALDVVALFDSGSSLADASTLPVHWWCAPDFSPPPDSPIPLLVLDGPCRFRDMAIAALDEAGIPWRIALTSASVSAVWSAAAAGLGVSPRTGIGVPDGLVRADAALLPVLGRVGLAVRNREGGVAGALASVVRATIQQRLPD